MFFVFSAENPLAYLGSLGKVCFELLSPTFFTFCVSSFHTFPFCLLTFPSSFLTFCLFFIPLFFLLFLPFSLFFYDCFLSIYFFSLFRDGTTGTTNIPLTMPPQSTVSTNSSTPPSYSLMCVYYLD